MRCQNQVFLRKDGKEAGAGRTLLFPVVPQSVSVLPFVLITVGTWLYKVLGITLPQFSSRPHYSLWVHPRENYISLSLGFFEK